MSGRGGMRIGVDAREAWRPEPRGIGLYVRHLMREFATQAPDHEFLLYHQLTPPEGGPAIPANMRAVHTDLPGGRWHTWERLQMPWRLRRDRLDEWSRRDICTRFGADPAKVRLSLNGLHPAVLAGAPPGAGDAARQRFAAGRPYLFAIGAALERKNTGRLLDAWGMVRRQRPDWPHLLLVSGLGGAVDRFRDRAAAAGALEHVRFLPYLSQPDLVALYAGASLSVYPSLVEGWGIPVCESLALGTPVITSDTSAMPEAGGAHARYFDPHSAEAIAAAILDGIERYAPAFAAQRDAAIARARTFTWARTAAGVLAAYHAAVDRRG